jgi:hypothetical protein
MVEHSLADGWSVFARIWDNNPISSDCKRRIKFPRVKQHFQLALEKSVRTLLVPLARLLMKHGYNFDQFSEMARRAFLTAARADAATEGHRPTQSAIATRTGLTRKEVARLLDLALAEQADGAAAVGVPPLGNRAIRVLSGWVREYSDRQGAPRPMPLDGASPSFAELVKRFSGDMTPRAVLLELERIDAVQFDAKGRLRLTKRSFVPPAGDPGAAAMLGPNVRDLIATIAHNLRSDTAPFLQRKTEYDNVPLESLPEIRAASRRAAERLIDEVDALLARHDRDANATTQGTGRYRVMLGAYYFDESQEAR